MPNNIGVPCFQNINFSAEKVMKITCHIDSVQQSKNQHSHLSMSSGSSNYQKSHYAIFTEGLFRTSSVLEQIRGIVEALKDFFSFWLKTTWNMHLSRIVNLTASFARGVH